MVGGLRICSVKDCEMPHWARDLCDKHYQRWRIHGSTELPKHSLLTRLVAKVKFGNECWEWQGASHPLGYGRIHIRPGKNEGAHRVMWRFFNGPIPSGHELDHLCRNPPCVRPDHLEPVTHQENVIRGDVHKRFCVRGHDTYKVGRSNRRCRECARIYDRNRKRKAKT